MIPVSKMISCGVGDRGLITGKGRNFPFRNNIVAEGAAALVERVAWIELEAIHSPLYSDKFHNTQNST
jgi:hypothetical protein